MSHQRLSVKLYSVRLVGIVLMIAMAGCGGGGGASPSIAGSTPTPTMPAPTVTLSPGNSIEKAVNANPDGTTFILQPGVYRNQSVISLKNGDSFIGASGAVMDGAKVLTGWTQVSINGVLYWTTAGGAPLTTPACNAGTTISGAPVSCCLAAYPACTYVQDLYVNDIEYQHVVSLAEVVAGVSWYYDFDGTDGGTQNNIYLAAGDDPNSQTVELGDTTYAFEGTAANITIKNLTIEKYASPLLNAAVEVKGPNWLVQNNEICLNHGVGVSDVLGGDNIQVLSNNIHNNGESGVGGPGSGGLWNSNTIAYNSTDGVNTDFAGSGSKFAGSNITISNNMVHDNNGPGLWSDSSATNNTYNQNISYNNVDGGIRYEISQYGVITNNTVYGNTVNAQIVYTGSDHGRINGNTVIDSGHGAILVVNTAGSRLGTVYQVTDTQVTDNTVWMSSNATEVAVGLIDRAQPPEPGIFTDPTNFFDHNIYQFSGPVRSSWGWGETATPLVPISWSAWRAAGQDLHGSLVEGVSPPR